MLPLNPLQYERASNLKREYLASAFVKTLKRKLKLKKEFQFLLPEEFSSVQKMQRALTKAKADKVAAVALAKHWQLQAINAMQCNSQLKKEIYYLNFEHEKLGAWMSHKEPPVFLHDFSHPTREEVPLPVDVLKLEKFKEAAAAEAAADANMAECKLVPIQPNVPPPAELLKVKKVKEVVKKVESSSAASAAVQRVKTFNMKAATSLKERKGKGKSAVQQLLQQCSSSSSSAGAQNPSAMSSSTEYGPALVVWVKGSDGGWSPACSKHNQNFIEDCDGCMQAFVWTEPEQNVWLSGMMQECQEQARLATPQPKRMKLASPPPMRHQQL
jgi:hypothetical protein